MSDDVDAYVVCRHVQHYWRKNGYGPTRELLGLSEDYLATLVRNGVVEVFPLYEGGLPIKVSLTEKGARMADAQRHRRGWR